MNRAPSILAAALLAAFLCLGSEGVLAQCSDCICASDSTCSNVSCGSSPTANCTRVEFTAACTGDYVLRVHTDCQDSECGGCQTCATVWRVDNGIEYYQSNCHDNNCNTNDCKYTCAGISLSAGSRYALYVCKVPCPGAADDCSECKSVCVAKACLAYGLSGSSCLP